jgi:hypothetical protein
MAIKKDDLILASDVVELQVSTDSFDNYVPRAPGGNEETQTHYITIGPSQKATIKFKTDNLDGSGNSIQIYSKRQNEETYTLLGDFSFSTFTTTVHYIDLLHEFLEFKLVVTTSAGLFVDNNTYVDFIRSVLPDIALANEPIRVLNGTYSEWLPRFITQITVALYNTGRVGYE